MDSQQPPPILFANRLIRMSVDHLAGADMIILPDDYIALRAVFRKCNGSWELLSKGDIVHSRLLATLVTAWSSMPERKRETELT